MSLSPYQILEINPNASWEEVKKTWKRQALKWHPDKNLDNTEEAERKFKEINNAFEQIRKEKIENNEEEIPANDLNPQDIIDELFFESGFENFESWSKHFSNFIKETVIESIKISMAGIENEINTDPNFWNRFGRGWEDKINQMGENDRILSFQDEMFEALQKISEEKLAKEKAKMDEFDENVDKGLKFIKSYLQSKNLRNDEFNDWIKTHISPPMTEKNWYEQPINWGHKDSINTYIYMIDSCIEKKQMLLDEQRANWNRKKGGDYQMRAEAIAEINSYWYSIKNNEKKLEDCIGSDWRAQINNSKKGDISKKKHQFKKLIDNFKQSNQKQNLNLGPKTLALLITGSCFVVGFLGFAFYKIYYKHKK